MSFDSFKQEMSIADVTEDEENYYISYVFSTFDVKDYFWQNQNKTQILKVSKNALKGGEDLGLYVQKELSQVMDPSLRILKPPKRKNKRKAKPNRLKQSNTPVLKGLVLNSRNQGAGRLRTGGEESGED